MKKSWKTLCLAAVVSAGCLAAATEAAAHSESNRYERRGERRSYERRGGQRQRGRVRYNRNPYSLQRGHSRGTWAPGIPEHQVDMDSDGVPNIRDRDQDGDGVPNHRDRFPRDERRC